MATRRIAAGEVVFRDDPTILGPDTVTREHKMCPACFFPMNRLARSDFREPIDFMPTDFSDIH